MLFSFHHLVARPALWLSGLLAYRLRASAYPGCVQYLDLAVAWADLPALDHPDIHAAVATGWPVRFRLVLDGAGLPG